VSKKAYFVNVLFPIRERNVSFRFPVVPESSIPTRKYYHSLFNSMLLFFFSFSALFMSETLTTITIEVLIERVTSGIQRTLVEGFGQRWAPQ
jgi:hypothetical protein